MMHAVETTQAASSNMQSANVLGQTAPHAAALQAADNSISENAIAYNNLPTIVRILEDARTKRATLTIKLETGSRLYIYHSRIQHLDAVGMQIMLHRLAPSNWQTLVTHEMAVEVSCQLPSGLLRFTSTLYPLEAETIDPYCVLDLPILLYKHQLRSSFRVMMPPGSSSLALPLPDRALNGYCLNLSLEGCCGIFRGNLETLKREVYLPALTVSLDDSLQFTTAATVCRNQVMQNGSTQLGMQFQPLAPDLQRKLQASLTSLQRRILRKQA